MTLVTLVVIATSALCPTAQHSAEVDSPRSVKAETVREALCRWHAAAALKTCSMTGGSLAIWALSHTGVVCQVLCLTVNPVERVSGDNDSQRLCHPEGGDKQMGFEDYAGKAAFISIVKHYTVTPA